MSLSSLLLSIHKFFIVDYLAPFLDHTIMFDAANAPKLEIFGSRSRI
jgi:hypothetical protein